MGNSGKIIGGLIGFAFGGPIGAIAGAALGSAADTESTGSENVVKQNVIRAYDYYDEDILKKNEKIYSKKNQSSNFNYVWDVKELDSKNDLYGLDECNNRVLLYIPFKFILDRRYYDTSGIVGDIVNVSGYYRSYKNPRYKPNEGMDEFTKIQLKIANGSIKNVEKNSDTPLKFDVVKKYLNDYREIIEGNIGLDQLIRSSGIPINSPAEITIEESVVRDNEFDDYELEPAWTREDLNEYYGFDRDYEGDWD